MDADGEASTAADAELGAPAEAAPDAEAAGEPADEGPQEEGPQDEGAQEEGAQEEAAHDPGDEVPGEANGDAEGSGSAGPALRESVEGSEAVGPAWEQGDVDPQASDGGGAATGIGIEHASTVGGIEHASATGGRTMRPSHQDSYIDELKAAYLQWQGDGPAIPVEQVAEPLRLLGYAPSEKELRSFCDRADGKTNLVNAGIFAALCEELDWEDPGDETLVTIFEHFDRQKTGSVPRKVFANIMTLMGEALSFEELEMALQELATLSGTPTNEKVNYLDFIEWAKDR